MKSDILQVDFVATLSTKKYEKLKLAQGVTRHRVGTVSRELRHYTHCMILDCFSGRRDSCEKGIPILSWSGLGVTTTFEKISWQCLLTRMPRTPLLRNPAVFKRHLRLYRAPDQLCPPDQVSSIKNEF